MLNSWNCTMLRLVLLNTLHSLLIERTNPDLWKLQVIYGLSFNYTSKFENLYELTIGRHLQMNDFESNCCKFEFVETRVCMYPIWDVYLTSQMGYINEKKNLVEIRVLSSDIKWFFYILVFKQTIPGALNLYEQMKLYINCLLGIKWVS